jgi:spore coat polysaccharide biosynthesis protein SpsF
MRSSRLPGKVLADVGGMPLLSLLVRRLRLARRVEGVVLATSDSPADDALAAWAAREGVAIYRGSEDDVLSRVVGAQKSMGGEIVVEVCGDTPLVDPGVVDRAVDAYLAGAGDVVTNTVRPSYPQGCEAQVFSLADLAEVDRDVRDPAVREHVSLHFYETPSRYRIAHLEAPEDERLPEQRLQVDYPEDLELVRTVHARLSPKYGIGYPLSAIVDLLRRDRALAALNRHCVERSARSQ